MLRYRKVLLAISVIGVVGSLSTTLAYALHLRSDGHRRALEAKLSRTLRMDTSIGSVEPLSLSSRQLNDVRVRSKRREADVFGCERAVWRRTLQSGQGVYSLELIGGWLVVGTNSWGAGDYREILQTGLGHDFAALGVRDIRLHSIDLRWTHSRAQFVAERTVGDIRFDGDGIGRASLLAPCLNGIEVDTPISISARFTPGERVRFHEVAMNVPEAPLRALSPDAFVGAAVTRGRFAGTVRYREGESGPLVTVSGAVHDALLNELTHQVRGGPYDGRVDIVVDEATFGASALQMLRFSGELHDLDLGQVAPVMDPPLSGRLDLRVHQAVYEKGRIDYFSGEGRADRVSLAALTGLIGRGQVTGSLKVAIHSLLFVDGRLVLADVTLDAVADADVPGTIDRAMLRTVSKQALGFDATRLLPDDVQQIEYTRLGVRLELNRNELRVHGSHGQENKTILTVNLLGSEMGIIKAPQRTFRVDDLVELARRHLGQYSADDVRRWLTGPKDRRPDGD